MDAGLAHLSHIDWEVSGGQRDVLTRISESYN